MSFRKYEKPDTPVPQAKPQRPKQQRLGTPHAGPTPATKCKVCAKLPPTEHEALKEDWLHKGLEPDALAAKYKTGPKAMARHIRRCLFNKHRSRYDRLRTLMDDVFVDIDLARQAFRENPSFNNSCSYQGLLREFRSTLDSLENIQDSDELIEELIELVINPLIRRMTRIIASEAGSIKEDLATRLGEAEAETLVHDLVDRVKEQFSDEVGQAGNRLAQTLGAKDNNRKRALGGKPSGKPDLKAV